MYYFHVAPARFRKFLVVLRGLSERRGQILAGRYVRYYNHHILRSVEVLEHDDTAVEVPAILPITSTGPGLSSHIQNRPCVIS